MSSYSDRKTGNSKLLNFADIFMRRKL